jgi:Mor family transcriptional regulator
MMPDIDCVERLPANAQDLARLIGLPAVLRLVGIFGGLTLRVPHGETPLGRALLAEIARVVGQSGARALVNRYAGTQLYIPNCKRALLMARDRALLAKRRSLADAGMSERAIVAELARAYRVSDRHVWTLLKKPVPHEAPAPRQQQCSLL